MIENVVSDIRKRGIHVLFSTDIIGFAGSTKNIVPFLDLVCDDLGINYGLEFVAFNHLLKDLHDTPNLAPKVFGFHGRVGPVPPSSQRPKFDRLKVAFANQNIPNTNELLNTASGLARPVYVNVHNLELSPSYPIPK